MNQGILSPPDMRSAGSPPGRALDWGLLLVAVGTVLFTLLRLAIELPGYGALARIHPSGGWAGLAYDLAHEGVFYRPLLSEMGYGGTRYFPLHVLLHAALLRAGLSLVVSGYVLTLGAQLALWLGTYALLRRCALPPRRAILFGALSLAFAANQLSLAVVRGDALPAALNIWGLCLCYGPPDGKRSLLGAAVLFSLAILAKATCVFGWAAAILWLRSRGELRQAGFLLAVPAVLIGIGFGLVHVGSEGRFLASLQAVGSGGLGFADALRLPWTVLTTVPPSDLVLLGLAGVVLLRMPASGRRELLPLAWVGCLGVTLLLFTSPGIDFNHVLDQNVLALGLVAQQIPRWGARARIGLAVLAAAALVGLLTTGLIFGWASQRPHIARILATSAGESGPLLAENPWFPLWAGERPYLLDAFNFRTAQTREPRLLPHLLDRLEQQHFRAVILLHDLQRRSGGKLHYRDIHFGVGFIEQLQRNYCCHQRIGSFYVWLPRKSPHCKE